ncbi:TrmH family RNA methyltransferase [Neisseria animalis]|uniref:RNA methyltransferase n=1 Tax=Neisseria animalis TaxID=492 RepID=A0A5P3MWE6_NEIAN|nr:RNA methyltransferase [Neisseria animalis]QEY25081.1 RNA methyltransferase [Neisseria animalis]ROW31680.1 RNA methyltransferase [Neisseria animalis]
MKSITSAHNEQLKHLSKLLTSARSRREHGQTVLEGIHLLKSYLQAGLMPLQVYLPQAQLQNAELQTALNALPDDKITLIGDGALAKITSLSDADDVMTLITIPRSPNLPRNGDCVVLDRVQDPGNVGTVIRSAAAAGITQLICSKDCADVWSPKVLRAGMGAHFLLEVHTRTDLPTWFAAYPHPIRATALSEQHNFSLYDLDLSAPSAWVFGNEGCGVSEEILAAVSHTVKIPMPGQTESLNVAMAATVCLFEQMRQRLA